MLTNNIKFALVISGLIIISATLFLIAKPKEYAYQKNLLTENTTDLIQTETTNSDTDEDGLKNWEEIFWGSDPKNPDSDNDGTKDGDEVRSGRNPIVKSLNDKIAKTEISSSSKSTADQTETERFAKNFFSKYIELRQNGILGDEASRQDLVNEIMYEETLRNNTITPYHYILNNLFIVEDTDENIKNYGNKFAEIYIKYTKKYTLNPVPNIVSEDTIDTFAKAVKDTSLIYRDLAKELISIKTPKSISEKHLKFTNSIYTSYESLLKLSGINKDPISSFSGIKDQRENSLIQEEILIEIAKYLLSQKVDFKTTDPGFFWYQKI